MIESTHIPGVFTVDLPNVSDDRGSFCKLLKTSFWDFLPGLAIFEPRDIFYSTSSLNTLRGMHYQTNTESESTYKIISCINGSALDVVVDPRKNSPVYNKPFSIHLNSKICKAIVCPTYIAHGFLSNADSTTLVYIENLHYEAKYDCSVNWKSIEYDWPCTDPIVSLRDDMAPNI